MAFEMQKGVQVCNYLANMDKSQQSIDAVIALEEAASKVVCQSVQIVLDQTQFEGSEVKVSGKACFKVVYTDLQNQTKSEEVWQEFNIKSKVQASDKIIKVQPIVQVIEDATKTVQEQIKCSATIELSGTCVIEGQINYIENIQGDVSIKKEQITAACIKDCFENSFSVVEDIELDKNTIGILSTVFSVCVKKAEATEGGVKIFGITTCNISTLVNKDEQEEIVCNTYNNEFMQIVTGVTPQQDAPLAINLCITDIKTEAEQANDAAVLKTEVVLLASGYSCTVQEMEVVSDAYSYTNYTELTVQSYTSSNLLPSVFKATEIEIQAELDKGMPFAEQVLGVCNAQTVVTDCFCKDGKITVEGMAAADVMYLSDEKQEYCYNISQPFSKTFELDGLTEQSVCTAIASVTSAECKIKKGKDVMLDMLCNFNISTFSSDVGSVLSDVIIGEEKPEENCAIIIHIVLEGQTLWDIAKMLNCSEQTILQQNPNAAAGLEKGQRIVVYKKANVTFA